MIQVILEHDHFFFLNIKKQYWLMGRVTEEFKKGGITLVTLVLHIIMGAVVIMDLRTVRREINQMLWQVTSASVLDGLIGT